MQTLAGSDQGKEVRRRRLSGQIVQFAELRRAKTAAEPASVGPRQRGSEMMSLAVEHS